MALEPRPSSRHRPMHARDCLRTSRRPSGSPRHRRLGWPMDLRRSRFALNPAGPAPRGPRPWRQHDRAALLREVTLDRHRRACRHEDWRRLRPDGPQPTPGAAPDHRQPSLGHLHPHLRRQRLSGRRNRPLRHCRPRQRRYLRRGPPLRAPPPASRSPPSCTSSSPPAAPASPKA